MGDEQILVVDDSNGGDVLPSNNESSVEVVDEVDLTAIQEELKNLVRVQKKSIKSQNEIIDTFMSASDSSVESENEFNEKFLELYSRNSSKILEQLELVNSSTIALTEKVDVSNVKFSSVVNLGIVGVCGLGFLCGAVLMSVFSRYFKH